MNKLLYSDVLTLVLGVTVAIAWGVYLWLFHAPWYYWFVAGPFCLAHAVRALYYIILPEPKGLTEDEARIAAREWMRENNLDRRW